MPDAEFFLSESSIPIRVRRGDPLGLRAATDSFADILAPGLTNRTWDARWLTLLAWIMVRVDEAWKQLKLDTGLEGLARQREIYKWIRPLELMLVERAVRTVQDHKRLNHRQLPGRRALVNMVAAGGDDQFGMRGDQLDHYRFGGPHGAYRGLLGRMPRMTVNNDGHTPDRVARSLARVIDKKLPAVKHPRRRRGPKPHPIAYWNEAWRARNGQLAQLNRWLPGRSDEAPVLLAKERSQIKATLFEGSTDAERRKNVAEAALKSKAKTHTHLCRDIVTSLSPTLERRELTQLRCLAPFTRLADAGVDAMVAVWRAATNQEDSPAQSVATIGAAHDVQEAIDGLNDAAAAWRRARMPTGDPILASAHRLAAEILRRQTTRGRLDALLQHHLDSGGGRKWFRLDGNSVTPDVPAGRDGAAHYRFRLWSLSRLAWQCGVVDQMPRALADEPDIGDDEEDRV